jgi:hypothetical protein
MLDMSVIPWDSNQYKNSCNLVGPYFKVLGSKFKSLNQSAKARCNLKNSMVVGSLKIGGSCSSPVILVILLYFMVSFCFIVT